MIAIIISVIALMVAVGGYIYLNRVIGEMIHTYDTQIDRIYKQMQEQGEYLSKHIDDINENIN